MRKPKPHDTHMITAVPNTAQPRRITIMYGTLKECEARLEHIRNQAVRNAKYRISPIPGQNDGTQ